MPISYAAGDLLRLRIAFLEGGGGGGGGGGIGGFEGSLDWFLQEVRWGPGDRRVDVRFGFGGLGFQGLRSKASNSWVGV